MDNRYRNRVAVTMLCLISVHLPNKNSYSYHDRPICVKEYVRENIINRELIKN